MPTVPQVLSVVAGIGLLGLAGLTFTPWAPPFLTPILVGLMVLAGVLIVYNLVPTKAPDAPVHSVIVETPAGPVVVSQEVAKSTTAVNTAGEQVVVPPVVEAPPATVTPIPQEALVTENDLNAWLKANEFPLDIKVEQTLQPTPERAVTPPTPPPQPPVQQLPPMTTPQAPPFPLPPSMIPQPPTVPMTPQAPAFPLSPAMFPQPPTVQQTPIAPQFPVQQMPQAPPFPLPSAMVPPVQQMPQPPPMPTTVPQQPMALPPAETGRRQRRPSRQTPQPTPTAQPSTTPQPSSAPSITSSGSNYTTDEAAQMLTAHNVRRSKLGSPNLTWDPTLAAFAQNWADNLKARDTPLEHRQPNKYGENLAWDSGMNMSPEQVLVGWVDEEAQFYNPAAGFNPDKPGSPCNDSDPTCCSRGKATGSCTTGANGQRGVSGHFTQSVWRNTTNVGCGIAKGNGQQWVVCNYSPPGNYTGQKAY